MDYADKLDMMDDDCDIQGFTLELKNYPYEEQRMDFFKQKRLEAKRRINYWKKRVPKTPYNSIQYEKACDAVNEYCFYNDIIVLLGGEDDENA